jgi:hypothetical protein
MVSFEEKDNMMKSFAKFRWTRTHAIVITSLIYWKANLPSLSHLKRASLFNNLLRGLTILTKFEMNLLMKFIWPKKDYKDFLSLGRGIFLMDSIIPRYTEIPSLEII